MSPSPLRFAEAVLPGHPDKLCDRAADLLVDAACARDPLALVGVEVALHRETVFVSGCISTDPPLDAGEVDALVRRAFADAGYGPDWSPDPARLRVVTDLRLERLDDDLRALRHISDDQAVCVGWAGGRAADRHLPRAHRLAWLAARALDRARRPAGFGPDGKVLVSERDGEVEGLSISLHHHPRVDRRALWRVAAEVAGAIGLSDLDRVAINAGGDFDVGGPHGDNGLSGKKLVFDAYGPEVPIGGGAWSGKDPHKVDRVGALRARQGALRALRLGLAREARLTLAWRPGDAAPSEVELRLDGEPAPVRLLGPLDLSIAASHRELGLARVRFAEHADGGWFQRPAPWEGPAPRLDRGEGSRPSPPAAGP